MFITRIALLQDGICVWFGREPRHFEENYYADGIRSLGESDTHSASTAWGRIDHLRDKNWWTLELEGQMITECAAIIGRVGVIHGAA